MVRTAAANMAQIIARTTDPVRMLRPLVYCWGIGLNVAEDDAAARSMLALSFILWRVHRLCVWNADEGAKVAVEIGRNSAVEFARASARAFDMSKASTSS